MLALVLLMLARAAFARSARCFTTGSRTKEPKRSTIDPIHQMAGLNTWYGSHNYEI